MDQDPFDYIVVGGGSAGCVLANRLPADRARPTRWNVERPVGNPTLLRDARFNRRHAFAPDPRRAGDALLTPWDKVLGCSSAVNGMIYIRGHHSDCDAWEAAGCTG